MATDTKNDGSSTKSQPREVQWEPKLPDATSDEGFLVACPQQKHPFFYLLNMVRNGCLVQTAAPDHVLADMNNTTTWQERFSLFCLQTLTYLRRPLAKVGQIVQLTGSTIFVNGGLVRTLFRLPCSALFFFKKGMYKASSSTFEGSIALWQSIFCV